MSREQLLRELAEERFGPRATAVRPAPPPAVLSERLRVLLAEPDPAEFMPPRQERDIEPDVIRMTVDMRWTSNQIAALLEVDESEVSAVLRRRRMIPGPNYPQAVDVCNGPAD